MQDKSNLRDFSSAQKRREFLEKQLSIKLDSVGNSEVPEDAVVGRNIENLIGATQIPLGVAGPLKIRSSHVIPSASEGSSMVVEDSSPAKPEQNDKKKKNYYIPLATTEGALVASVSRGCKAITEAGGATVYLENVGITRGPVFKTKGIEH